MHARCAARPRASAASQPDVAAEQAREHHTRVDAEARRQRSEVEPARLLDLALVERHVASRRVRLEALDRGALAASSRLDGAQWTPVGQIEAELLARLARGPVARV